MLMKKVLVLGAGMVAAPLVDHLLDTGHMLTVTGIRQVNIDRLTKGKENAEGVLWSVDEEERLREMIREHDIVVSLLPYAYHVMVANNCIDLRKSMVTTSYVSEEMYELHDRAREAGVMVLNEIGLDPGIDHMSAMRVIDKVHSKGGKIKRFFSICGALVAPQSVDNPLRYKFSWSPKGVILASKNSAVYRRNGELYEVGRKDLFKDPASLDFPGVGKMEVYPNRDSVKYIDLYGINGVETMYRGTFRHPGWCATLDAMKELDMLEQDKMDMKGKTYSGLTAALVGENSTRGIKEKTAEYLGVEADNDKLKALDWIGVFDELSIGREEDSPFEVYSNLMISKMLIQKEDIDMVALQHMFHVVYSNGKEEMIESRMLDYGIPGGDTAISRTVAWPAAIATRLILEGKIKETGVFRPIRPAVYEPVLEELEKLGIIVGEEYGKDPSWSLY